MDKVILTRIHAALYGALAIASLGCTSAQAADENPPSKRVKFADLNIQTQEGAKTLYRRIRVAAGEVCETSFGSDPIMRQGMRKCVDTAIDNAVRKVNAPYLTALRFGDHGTIQLASK